MNALCLSWFTRHATVVKVEGLAGRSRDFGVKFRRVQCWWCSCGQSGCGGEVVNRCLAVAVARSRWGRSGSASWARSVGRSRSRTLVRNIALCRPWSVTWYRCVWATFSMSPWVRTRHRLPCTEQFRWEPAELGGDCA